MPTVQTYSGAVYPTSGQAYSGVVYVNGEWNASTNIPSLASSVGIENYAYRVSVAGNTSLNGVSDWNVDDLIIFSGGQWRKIRGNIIESADITDSTTAGRTLLTAADAPAQRTALGATAAGSAIFTAANSSAQRSALDLGYQILDIYNRPAGLRRQNTSYNYGGRFVSIANNATQEFASYSGGPGYISDIWMCLNNQDDSSILTITTDGQTAYQGVVSQFFCAKYASSQAAFWTDLIGATNGKGGSNNVSFMSRIPIPFSNSFSITLQNKTGSAMSIPWDIGYQIGVANEWTRSTKFRAISQDYDAVNPYDFVDLVNVSGINPGRLLGISIMVDSFPGNANPPNGPWEGGIEIYLDGSANYILKTTGMEDTFFRAQNYWEGLPSTPSNTNSNNFTPYPRTFEGLTINTSNTKAGYRFFIPDPITFETGVRVRYQNGQYTGPGNGWQFTGTTKVCTTAFYYTT